MAGGNIRGSRCVAAPSRRAWAGALMLLAGTAAAAPTERSVIVAGSSSAAAAPSAPSAAELVLEPIAVASDAVPDLADAPCIVSDQPAEPSLADDYLDFADAGAADVGQTPSVELPAVDSCAIASPHEAVAATDDSQAADEFGQVRPQTASFCGITPGQTVRAEVRRLLGTPLNAGNGRVERYRLDGFPRVTVQYDDEDDVSALDVVLYEPTSAVRLLSKLGMEAIRPAAVFDRQGRRAATMYPERGVTFRHQPTVGAALASDDVPPAPAGENDGVYSLRVEPLSADAFLLRAEQCSAYEYVARVTDLEIALAIDESHVPARLLLSKIKLAAGEAEDAETLAAEAAKLAPEQNACRLAQAHALKYLARYDEAVAQAKLVVDGKTTTPLEKAEAYVLLGSLAALGSKQVREESLPLYNRAISVADPLAADPDSPAAVPATQLLVDAHLAVAETIAAGRWAKQEEMVAKWIARASALSETLIANGDADETLRLQVAVSALAASARLDAPINPELWVQEAEGAVADLQQDLGDLPVRDRLNWQLGLAYYYAAEVSHRRSKADEAIRYGELAEASLEPAADARRNLPDTDYVLGRLYFQIGAVHAVHYRDHDAACQWYDRAAELLMKPVPLTAQTSPAKHADALVSMGVSYWEIGSRDRAHELTKSGTELLRQAIGEGLVGDESLKVAQSNLDAMDRALGRESTVVAATEDVKTEAKTPASAGLTRRPRSGGAGQAARVADRRTAETSPRRR